MKKKVITNQILSVLFQVIPVVVGIYLALYINKNEAIKRDKEFISNLTKKAKEQIIRDTAQLNLDLNSHLQLSELLAAKMNDKITIMDIFIEGAGINVSSTNTNFLQMLVNSKIEYMNLEQSSMIFGILELTKEKEEYENLIRLNIYDNINDTSKKSKLKLSMLLNDYGLLQDRLLQYQLNFLEK